MREKIICVIGPSGSGKTLLVSRASEKLGISYLVSYTTRPQREDETDGVEHWFVGPEAKPDESEMLAYTRFGGYEYWTSTHDIIPGIPNFYVIDEKGYLNLKEKWGNSYDLVTVLIKRDRELLVRTVGEERVKRDDDRTIIDEKEYDAVIYNNGSLSDFIKNGLETIKRFID